MKASEREKRKNDVRGLISEKKKLARPPPMGLCLV